jgi:hypothetical protein
MAVAVDTWAELFCKSCWKTVISGCLRERACINPLAYTWGALTIPAPHPQPVILGYAHLAHTTLPREQGPLSHNNFA